MSPRHAKRRPDDSKPLGSAAAQRVEEWNGEEWIVRSITGSTSTKNYRCPGCDQEIRPATPHVVVWPYEGQSAVEYRRHWHKTCWDARDRRRPRS